RHEPIRAILVMDLNDKGLRTLALKARPHSTALETRDHLDVYFSDEIWSDRARVQPFATTAFIAAARLASPFLDAWRLRQLLFEALLRGASHPSVALAPLPSLIDKDASDDVSGASDWSETSVLKRA